MMFAPSGSSPAFAAIATAVETAADTAAETKATEVVELDPISLILNASGPVFLVVWLLIIASVMVWFIAVLKVLQLKRWSRSEASFEEEAVRCRSADDVYEVAQQHREAPGARVVLALRKRRDVPAVLEATAKRAMVDEQKRASTLMPTLASIGAASPFIGLFGTVYGIMDAFLRIGREKSASLPVVAPAIGEALIATAIGLFAAIPAVIAYNAIAKRVDDLLNAIEATSEGWVALAQVPRNMKTVSDSLSEPMPLKRRSDRPPA
jgi:biopolymer transport protein TolQ